MPSVRTLLQYAIGTTLPAVLFLLAVEVVLRVLPVPTAMRVLPVTEATPVFRFTPDRNFVSSVDWNFSIVSEGRVNNDGFVNLQDYRKDGPRPLVAVVGDSYVEAKIVPYAASFHGRLADELAGRARVYSFAASGAPLSQYLVWAQYARETYAPDAMIVPIIANDFDESLAEYIWEPGFHHFARNGAGELELQRFDFEPSRLRDALRSSALARYLFYNVQITWRLGQIWPAIVNEAPREYVGNTAAAASARRLAHSAEAVAAFFRELPQRSGLPPERVLFLIDGIRPELYDAAALARAEDSYFAQMRRVFVEAAESRGYEVQDLQPRFVERHRRDGVRFEFPTDAHWNETGHEVAAEAVRESRVFRSLFDG